MPFYDPLLYPFALVYNVATRVRNLLFDYQVKKSHDFKVATIAVGNLSVGGTGKTPFVEMLIEMLKKDFQIATLSRGYGRSSKGFIVATEGSGPSDIGDEPLQLFTKFRKEVRVTVGEKRALALPKILEKWPATNLVLMDDAFQHRYVKADYYILLTTYQNPFYEDYLLPLGKLRESRSGAERADVIVVTKCPGELTLSKKKEMEEKIKIYSRKGVRIIFSSLQYSEPTPVFNHSWEEYKNAVLVSGIANRSELIKSVKELFVLKADLDYEDHHVYTAADAKAIADLAYKYPDSVVLTTEKDATKLKASALAVYLKEIPIFALPVKIKLEEQDKLFLFNKLSQISKDKALICE
jgi:tetraacyldisaccharide 4'-kinase